jgi:spore coat protein U-like protein
MIKTQIAQWLLLLALCAVFTGRASATAVCSVSSAGAAFGPFDPISASPRDTLGTVTVTCTGSVGDAVSYTIALSPGAGSFATRNMQSGAANIKYNLFTDSTHNVIWGDGTNGTTMVSDNYTMGATTVSKDYTVFGEIPQQSGPIVGSYLDTVVITLTY